MAQTVLGDVRYIGMEVTEIAYFNNKRVRGVGQPELPTDAARFFEYTQLSSVQSSMQSSINYLLSTTGQAQGNAFEWATYPAVTSVNMNNYAINSTTSLQLFTTSGLPQIEMNITAARNPSTLALVINNGTTTQTGYIYNTATLPAVLLNDYTLFISTGFVPVSTAVSSLFSLSSIGSLSSVYAALSSISGPFSTLSNSFYNFSTNFVSSIAAVCAPCSGSGCSNFSNYPFSTFSSGIVSPGGLVVFAGDQRALFAVGPTLYINPALNGMEYITINNITFSGGNTTVATNGSVQRGSYIMLNGQSNSFCATAQGARTGAGALGAHSEGSNTAAISTCAHAEGQLSFAIGAASHAEGNNAIAFGDYSHAEGQGSIARGYCGHAEGRDAQALGNYSHAEGYVTLASGLNSHAEGSRVNVIGDYSHGEGEGHTLLGAYSHIEGASNYGSNYMYMHVQGLQTTGAADLVTVQGYSTIGTGFNSHVIGFYADGKIPGAFTHSCAVYRDASGNYVKGSCQYDDLIMAAVTSTNTIADFTYQQSFALSSNGIPLVSPAHGARIRLFITGYEKLPTSGGIAGEGVYMGEYVAMMYVDALGNNYMLDSSGTTATGASPIRLTVVPRWSVNKLGGTPTVTVYVDGNFTNSRAYVYINVASGGTQYINWSAKVEQIDLLKNVYTTT
jgi:hypothetical protein